MADGESENVEKPRHPSPFSIDSLLGPDSRSPSPSTRTQRGESVGRASGEQAVAGSPAPHDGSAVGTHGQVFNCSSQTQPGHATHGHLDLPYEAHYYSQHFGYYPHYYMDGDQSHLQHYPPQSMSMQDNRSLSVVGLHQRQETHPTPEFPSGDRGDYYHYHGGHDRTPHQQAPPQPHQRTPSPDATLQASRYITSQHSPQHPHLPSTGNAQSGKDLSFRSVSPRAPPCAVSPVAPRTPSPNADAVTSRKRSIEEAHSEVHRQAVSPSLTQSTAGNESSACDPVPSSTDRPSTDRPSTDQPSGAKRPKKHRTSFTPDQLAELEVQFNRNRYLPAPERAKLCDHLGLSELQVKTWFQNRRMKVKRMGKDGDSSPGTVASPPLYIPPPMTMMATSTLATPTSVMTTPTSVMAMVNPVPMTTAPEHLATTPHVMTTSFLPMRAPPGAPIATPLTMSLMPTATSMGAAISTFSSSYMRRAHSPTGLYNHPHPQHQHHPYPLPTPIITASPFPTPASLPYHHPYPGSTVPAYTRGLHHPITPTIM